jgi:hypothetical protein
MKLLEFENFEVKPTAEALLVRPIRRLYNADRSKQKERFYQQISYLFFMVDPRSTYSYIIDPEERAQQIILQEGLPKDFKPSSDLEEAMRIYEQHITTSSKRLLESTKIAVDALSEELRQTKERLRERTEKGAAVTKVNDVMGTLEKVLKFIPQLQDLERKVDAEIKDTTRARGTSNSMFENGV